MKAYRTVIVLYSLTLPKESGIYKRLQEEAKDAGGHIEGILECDPLDEEDVGDEILQQLQKANE